MDVVPIEEIDKEIEEGLLAKDMEIQKQEVLPITQTAVLPNGLQIQLEIRLKFNKGS